MWRFWRNTKLKLSAISSTSRKESSSRSLTCVGWVNWPADCQSLKTQEPSDCAWVTFLIDETQHLTQPFKEGLILVHGLRGRCPSWQVMPLHELTNRSGKKTKSLLNRKGQTEGSKSPLNWRKKIGSYSSNGGLISRVHKNLKLKKQLTTKNNLINEPMNWTDPL